MKPTLSSIEETVPFRWVILSMCVLCFVFTFFDRFVWPPLIPVVVPILGMKMSQAGAYMSAFYLGYIITQIPAGILADRFGVRVILGASLIIEGITTFGMGYITTYDTGFALRIATGLGAGAVYAACARSLMEWFPPRERGLAFGLLFGAPSAGIILASVTVPPLNSVVGWTGAFKAVGMLTVFVGIATLLLVRSSVKAPAAGSMFGGFRIVFGHRDLILTALAGFCLMWLELGTASWTIAYVKKLGFTLGAAGSVLMFYGIGGLIAPPISGYLSDKIGHRKWILIIALLVVAPITIVFGRQTDLTTLSAVGFLFGFCSYFANPHLTIFISEFAGKQWAATANGAANVMFQIASMIGPPVIGWFIDTTGSFAIIWWIMAAGPLLGILLLLPVNPEHKAA